MRKRTKVLTGVAVTGLLVAGAGSAAVAAAAKTDPPAERNAERRFTDEHRADATVPQAAAEQAARVARPGTLSDTHLEDEGHGLRWEVKSDDGTRVWEIQVDAASGAVVSNHGDE